MHLLFSILLLFLHLSAKAFRKPPNIIMIVADDLGKQSHFNNPNFHYEIESSGVNDVSWNNPEVKTPNLEKLAQSGIILNKAYTLPICSPSRAALLTGVYPFKFGLQVRKGERKLLIPLLYPICYYYVKVA